MYTNPRAIIRAGLRVASASLLTLGASAAQSGPPDVVTERLSSGGLRPRNGAIVENSLTKVVIEESGGRTRTIDAGKVVRIQWGRVPPAFAEGRTYAQHGDNASAAASYRVAAGDANASDPARAAARLRAARALLLAGGAEPPLFAEALSELDRFVTDYPDARDLPEARLLRARATHLSGDPASAAAEYLALEAEVGDGSAPTAGYPLPTCYLAGLRGAHALLEAGDIAGARAAFDKLKADLSGGQVVAASDADMSAALGRLAARARLGDGYLMTAEGKPGQAATFFRSELQGAKGKGSAAELGARLGLGMALLADGEPRQASLEFALVSALDHTDRDRTARARFGLARCALDMGAPDAADRANQWLTDVTQILGDTPAAAEARELLGKL